jgi:hypothetical protein
MRASDWDEVAPSKIRSPEYREPPIHRLLSGLIFRACYATLRGLMGKTLFGKLSRARLIALGCCGLLVVAYGVISYSAVITKSATYDEPLHAVGAWTHLRFGDFRMNFEDPPLWKYIAAIPNGRNAIRPGFESNPYWKTILDDAYRGFGYATNVLYQTPGNDGGAFVNRSRFMMMLIGATLGIVIITWAWKLAGPVAGVIAAILYCLDPNALGYGPLVKNDVSMSLVLTGAFMALWYVGRRLTIVNALALALVTAAAVNTKFSALLMGPMIVAALILRALLPMPWNVLGRSLKSWRARLGVAAALCVGVALVSYLGIWASYRFRFGPTDDPAAALNTLQHKLDLLKYQFAASHPQPQARPFDPATPIKELADQLTRQVQAMSASLEELTTLLKSAELSDQTAASIRSDAASIGAIRDAAAEQARRATNFADNIPPPAARAEDFDAQLLNISRQTHDTSEQLSKADYALTMLMYYARHGDKAPDGFTRVLNVALDHHLLPSAWLHGILLVHARSLIRGSYLLGEVRGTGWWYYFPLAMLFKTPVATILALLGAAAGGVLVLRQRGQQWRNWIWPLACLLVPSGIYLLSVMAANLNIGLRHVLPVYPFMYIAAAVLIAWMIRRWGRWATIGAAALAVLLAIETLSVFPNYIAYFNFACGGSRGGLYLLADSNLDWGQDLPALAEWQKQHPNEPLAFGPAFTDDPNGGSYFGTVDPAFYGIRSVPLHYDLRPEVVHGNVLAISATLIQGVYGSPFPQFRDVKPIEVLNGTIYLYDLRNRR